MSFLVFGFLMDFSYVCRRFFVLFRLSTFQKDTFLPKCMHEILFNNLSHRVKSSAVALKTSIIMDKLFAKNWGLSKNYQSCQVLPFISRDFCFFSIDWSLFSGKTIYSSFSDNYTYGICILIKKTVVMSDSYSTEIHYKDTSHFLEMFPLFFSRGS